MVRALWANKPFVWQIYPQHDDAHHSKLEAFLDVMNAPPSLRNFHNVWNGLPDADQAVLPALALDEWQETVSKARNLQLQHDDLVTQLMRFVLKNH